MSTPAADMPPRFLRRAPMNNRFERRLLAAAMLPLIIARQQAEAAIWAQYGASGRYRKTPTASQQKRRRAMRRENPSGWKGGVR